MNQSRRSSHSSRSSPRILEVEAGIQGTISRSAARKESQQHPDHQSPIHQNSVSNVPVQTQVCLLLAALLQHRAGVGIDQATSFWSRCKRHEAVLPNYMFNMNCLTVLRYTMLFEAVLELQAHPEGTLLPSAPTVINGSQQHPIHQQPVNNMPVQAQVCLLLPALPQHRARVGIDQAA